MGLEVDHSNLFRKGSYPTSPMNGTREIPGRTSNYHSPLKLIKHSPDMFTKTNEADRQSWIDECNPGIRNDYEDFQDHSIFTVGAMFIEADGASGRPRDQEPNPEMMFNQDMNRNVTPSNQIINNYETNFENIHSTPKQNNQQALKTTDSEQIHGYFSGTNQTSKQKSLMEYQKKIEDDINTRCSRGLKVLSVKVRDIVYQKRQTSYKEVADA